MKTAFYAALAVFAAAPAFAQNEQAARPAAVDADLTAQSAPLLAAVRPVATGPSLPANTELLLRMNEELTSKTAREGTSFRLTLTHDILLDNFIVVPRGTPAIGEVTWRTGKGMFGKSAKMEFEMRYLDLGGRRIPISGKFRQEGDGNTVGTIAAVVAIPIAGMLVTGKSAVVPAGRELKAFTTEAVSVALPTGAPVQPPAVLVVQPVPPAAPVAAVVTPTVMAN